MTQFLQATQGRADPIVKYCCVLQTDLEGAVVNGDGFIVEFQGLQEAKLLSLTWEKRSKTGELQTDYALITSHDTMPGLSPSALNNWTFSCQEIESGKKQKLSNFVCGVISCCGSETLFAGHAPNAKVFVAHHGNANCDIQLNIAILFLNKSFEKFLQRSTGNVRTLLPPVVPVGTYLDQTLSEYEQIITTRGELDVYCCDWQRVKTTLAKQQDTSGQNTASVLNKKIVEFERLQKLETCSTMEIAHGSPVVYLKPDCDEPAIMIGVYVGKTKRKEQDRFVVTFRGILRLLQGGLVPVLSVLHCLDVPHAWVSRWGYLVTPHIDQMKKMESGFVCEVLHFLLKKSSRYGTPLVKFPVDLVEMDNEASLDLLRALFKHIKSADNADLNGAVTKLNLRNEINAYISRLCKNVIHLLKLGASSMVADRTSLVEKCLIFYNLLLHIKFVGVTEKVLCTSDLLKEIRHRYKDSAVVQETTFDISLKCFESLESLRNAQPPEKNQKTEPDPTVDYMEKPGTATKRKQTGGEEQESPTVPYVEKPVRATTRKRKQSGGEQGVPKKRHSSNVTSVAATHTPSLAAADDGTIFPSSESTTSSNQDLEMQKGAEILVDPPKIAQDPEARVTTGKRNQLEEKEHAYQGSRQKLYQSVTSQDTQRHDAHSLMLSENLTLTRMKELEFDYNGGKYHAPEDGYSLTVPKGAIPEKLGLVSMQCGVVPYGPLGTFKYPNDIKPVSPIVWFCMTSSVEFQKFEFQKCVEITIPHCLDCETAEDSQSLAFFKANHIVSDSSPRIFHFEKAEGISSFSPNTSYGTLHSKHLCFYCVGSSHKEVTNRANFCLITAKPVYFQRRSKIHFCLTYFLETCLKAVKEQFSDADYDLTARRKVKFQKTTRDPAIEIKFNRSLPNGWKITRESQSKICASQVYFWDNERVELELMHREKMYPPRFTLEVHGGNATDDTVALVEFEGACMDLSTEIYLSLPTTATHTPSVAPRDDGILPPSSESTSSNRDINNLADIIHYLHRLDRRALINLGLVLGLDYNRLRPMMDTPTFLQDMLTGWLQRVDRVPDIGVPTWRGLAEALRDQIVGQNGVANEIEKNN